MKRPLPLRLPLPSLAPIVDDNCDGWLDSKELLTQLDAEDRNGYAHTPSEKAHLVLEGANISTLVKKYEGLFSGPPNEALKKQAATELTALLMENIQLYREFATQNGARAREYIEYVVDRAAKENKLSANAKALYKAKILNTFDFAQSFNETFKHGLKLDAEHATAILDHFRPRPTLSTYGDPDVWCRAAPQRR